MKKLIFVILISFILLFGCTATTTDEEGNKVTTEVKENDDGSKTVTWSKEVAALGEPTYKSVEISTGYKILPFPGLTYSGYRDGWQAFYATNSDYTFAIYASPQVNSTSKSYEELKEEIKNTYIGYDSTISCNDISTNNFITQTKAFSCKYNYGDTISYDIVTFYKEGAYIQTDLSVWGASLQNYTYIFDEFNQKAVSWK